MNFSSTPTFEMDGRKGDFELSAETILENINEGICVIAADGTVKYWNQASDRLYGVKREEILNNKIVDFFPNALCLAVLETGERVEYVEHRPREGSLVVISAAPIKVNGMVKGAISIDHDITGFRRADDGGAEEKNRAKHLESVGEIIKQNQAKSGFESIICQSRQMQKLIHLAQKVAETEAAVIITGESGTGKDLFARALHWESSRRNEPFVVVDCGSISPNLIESELFGYDPGAFTGAQKAGKPGKFELADGGTVFLDEIGELPLEMQAKLLRVLESGEFYRVSGIRPIKINIRVIAATNRNIQQMVQEGTFRQDLFYRLNVFSLRIPALRERPEDIPLLMDYYLKRYSVLNRKVIDRIAPEVISMLLHYHWPGNVRELKNLMERLVVLAENHEISPQSLELLLESVLQDGRETEMASFKTLMELEPMLLEIERQTILKALASAKHNLLKAAEILNIPRSTLYYKLQKLGIPHEKRKKGRPSGGSF